MPRTNPVKTIAVNRSSDTALPYDFWFLNAAAYLTLALSAVRIVLDMPSLFLRGTSALLLLLFGVLLTFCLRTSGWQKAAQAYIAAQTLLILAVFALSPENALGVQPLFFLLSAQALLLLPLWSGVSWLVPFTLITLGGAYYVEGSQSLIPVLAACCGYLCFALFGASMRRAQQATQRSEELFVELQDVNQKLVRYAAQSEQLAVSEERNRISREIHDALGHRLTVAVVQLEGARRLIEEEPEQSAASIDAVRIEMRDGLAELRQAVRSVRVESNQLLPDLLGQLTQQFEAVSGANVDLVLDTQGDVSSLPVAVGHALYRTTQEALTNVQKHGDASNVRVCLLNVGGNVSLCVEDDGVGLPDYESARYGQAETSEGFGLRGLAERAEELGGTMMCSESTMGGLRLQVDIPLRQSSTATD